MDCIIRDILRILGKLNKKKVCYSSFFLKFKINWKGGGHAPSVCDLRGLDGRGQLKKNSIKNIGKYTTLKGELYG